MPAEIMEAPALTVETAIMMVLTAVPAEMAAHHAILAVRAAREPLKETRGEMMELEETTAQEPEELVARAVMEAVLLALQGSLATMVP